MQVQCPGFGTLTDLFLDGLCARGEKEAYLQKRCIALSCGSIRCLCDFAAQYVCCPLALSEEAMLNRLAS